MIESEQYARIRRLFFAEHWKVGTIVAELGVHPDTVKRVIEAHRFTRLPSVRGSVVDPYKPFIEQVLDQHPKLRSTRLHAMLRSRGYQGGIVQLRRHVAQVRPAPRSEAYLRLRTLPGEQAQVDWGHFGKIPIGSARRALSCFVLVLGYSRALYARFTLDQTLESFLRCHVAAFDALGGVPREILYDNLKSVVLERQGEHIRFHPQILEFAGHYHFAPKPCAPYRGNEKGKVERQIHYLRYSFFEARRFSSLEDLNAQLAGWIETVAHVRATPGDTERKRVEESLAEERPRLLPLPEHPFACELVRGTVSGKTPYIRFDLNDYSIPMDWVGKPLRLMASESQIRLSDAEGKVVAEHSRCYDRGRLIEDPSHLAALARQKGEAARLRGRDRLRSACRNADALIEAIARRGDPLASQTQRLNQLLSLYGARALDAAMGETLERGAVSAESVAQIIEQKARARRQAPPIPILMPADARVRDLQVIPHRLAAYDALATDAPEATPAASTPSTEKEENP